MSKENKSLLNTLTGGEPVKVEHAVVIDFKTFIFLILLVIAAATVSKAIG